MKVTQSYLTLCDPMDYTVHGILQARILEWVAFPFSRGSSQPRDGTQSPALQADSLPAEPQGKPKKSTVGSPALFQQIFPIQESNWGLLPCSWVVYQLSYQWIPFITGKMKIQFHKTVILSKGISLLLCYKYELWRLWHLRGVEHHYFPWKFCLKSRVILCVCCSVPGT